MSLIVKQNGLRQQNVNWYTSIGKCIFRKCCLWPWPLNS